MSGEEEKTMRLLGWDFVQYDPNAWEWRKFNLEGEVTAQQGDHVWSADMIISRSET